MQIRITTNQKVPRVAPGTHAKKVQYVLLRRHDEAKRVPSFGGDGYTNFATETILEFEIMPDSETEHAILDALGLLS